MILKLHTHNSYHDPEKTLKLLLINSEEIDSFDKPSNQSDCVIIVKDKEDELSFYDVIEPIDQIAKVLGMVICHYYDPNDGAEGQLGIPYNNIAEVKSMGREARKDLDMTRIITRKCPNAMLYVYETPEEIYDQIPADYKISPPNPHLSRAQYFTELAKHEAEIETPPAPPVKPAKKNDGNGQKLGLSLG